MTLLKQIAVELVFFIGYMHLQGISFQIMSYKKGNKTFYFESVIKT